MLIVTTIVSPEGRGMMRGNGARIELAKAVLKSASGAKADLVVFPAGFLRARDEDCLEETAAQLFESADALRLGIVFGIDSASPQAKKVQDRVRRQCLPFFLVAKNPTSSPIFWRQRSTTAENGHDVPAVALVKRTLRLRGGEVDILACGEVFNHELRREVPWNDRMIVAPAHTAQRSRFFHAVSWAEDSKARCILRATHAYDSETSTGSTTTFLGKVEGATLRSWMS